MTTIQRNYMDKLPVEIKDKIYFEVFRSHHKNMLEELDDTWWKFNRTAVTRTIEWPSYDPSQSQSVDYAAMTEYLRRGPYYNYNSDDYIEDDWEWWDRI